MAGKPNIGNEANGLSQLPFYQPFMGSGIDSGVGLAYSVSVTNIKMVAQRRCVMSCDSTYKYLLQRNSLRVADSRDHADLCPCDCKLVGRLEAQCEGGATQAGTASDNVVSSAPNQHSERFSDRWIR